MPTYTLQGDAASGVAGPDARDPQIASRVRLLLAITGMLAIFLADDEVVGTDSLAPAVFGCYVLSSALIYFTAELSIKVSISKYILWLDCVWYFLINALTGGADSFFFTLFIFPIVVCSLRNGFDQGARITLLSVLMLTAAAFAADARPAFPQLLFRATSLMALGYLMARLGENRRQLKRRLDLLHSLTQMANPHFGVDRTITALLERTRAFFGAETCVTVARLKERCYMRTVSADSPLTVLPQQIDEQLARVLLAEPHEGVLLYRRRWRMRLEAPWQAVQSKARWVRMAPRRFEQAAELLGGGSIIGAPVMLNGGHGMVYMVRRDGELNRADALFLAHVVAQSLPVVENMALLDRLASNAASDERKKFALNLHDTAVQPYIGLTLGLAALRKKAGPANPLSKDLDRLAHMADSVIVELRAFAGSVRGDVGASEPLCLSALRRQAELVERCYGVRVTVDVQGRLALGDRISAEVLHIVREGLSNICRHTAASSSMVRMHCDDAMLRIEINNDNGGAMAMPFTPRSISERAAALGGRAYVKQGAVNSTAVCVEIPI